MAYGIVLVFDGVSEGDYWQVNDLLGINRDGSGDWPAGLQVHTGGSSGSQWVVTEIWDSKDSQEAFMANRLGAALGAAAMPEPSQIIESDLVNVQQPG
ncbi:MAG: hypothetical protein JWM05_2749 [Acidimicrobiales bacterium]|nr:hypothetical protein [Acidimicrobiales bacterium]